MGVTEFRDYEGTAVVTPFSREWALVANVREDPVLRAGAHVWILRVNKDGSRAQVYGMSTDQIPVTKYIPIHRLINWRSAWLPPKPLLQQRVMLRWSDRTKAADYAVSLGEESARQDARRRVS